MRCLLVFLFLTQISSAAELPDRLEEVSRILHNGEYGKALEIAGRLAREAEKASDDRSLGRAYLLISDAHYYLGHPEEYRTYVEKALQVYLKIGEVAGIGRAYYNLAYCYERSRPEKMIELLEQAKPYAQEAKDLRLQMNIENAFGTSYWHISRYREAITHLETSASLADRLQEAHSKAVAFQNIGLIYEYLAEYEKALGFYRRALGTFEKSGHRQGVAIVLGNMGHMHWTLGNLEEAFSCFHKSASISRDLDYTKGWIAQLMNLAGLSEDLGDDQQWRMHNEKALTLARESKNQRAGAEITRNLALGLLRDGDLTGAERYLRQSRAGALEIGDQRLLSMVDLGFARLLKEKGEHLAALEKVRAAKASAEKIGDLYHLAVCFSMEAEILESESSLPDALEAYNAAIRLHEKARILRNLPSWYANMAQIHAKLNDEARTRSCYDKSLAYVEQLDSVLATDRFRIHLFEEVTAIYHGYAAWLAARGEIGAAWKILEQGRTRSLLLRLAQALPAAETANDTEGRLLKQISGLQRRLREEEMERSQREDLLARISLLETEYEEAQRRRLRAQPASTKSSSLEFSTSLPLTIEYAFNRDKDELMVFSFDKGKVRCRSLPHAASLLNRAKFFREQLSDPKKAFRDHPAAESLYRTLLGPELDHHSGRVIIIPDDILYYIPFNAFIRNKKYIAEELIVSLAPSLTLLQRIREQRLQAAGRVLVVAATRFPDLPVYGIRLPDLPFSEKEARSLQKKIRQTELLVDQSEGRIRKTDFGKYEVVHFATHSLIQETHPERSGIVVAPGDREDGLLQAREIYRWRLPVRMVVLSSCGSGTGKLVAGEGLLGLSHALFTAGARSLVLSLWDVSDEATMEWMTRFYQQVPTGTIAESLQRTQKEMIVSRNWNHPGYWSAFVAVGDADQQLDLQPRTHSWWILVFVLLLAVFLLKFLRR